MHYDIRSRWDAAKIIYFGEASRLKDLVASAVANKEDLRGADLGGADLRGAYLRDADLCAVYLDGADLRCADLCGAYLESADLRGADLRRADLRGADLEGASLGGVDLGGADLRGAGLRGAYIGGADLGDPGKTKLSWTSHELLSEILWRAADGHPVREQLAAWIGRKTERCWSEWIAVDHAEREWAIDVLSCWAVGDDTTPEILRKRNVIVRVEVPAREPQKPPAKKAKKKSEKKKRRARGKK